mgnify:CR=1 FL=1
MNIEVHSRDTIRNIKPKYPFIVISIFDPRSFPAPIGKSTNCKGILQLSFDDVDAKRGMSYEEQSNRDEVCITETQAQLIADFVKAYKDRVELIICQCEAGISRSAGVAAAIADYFNQDSNRFYNGSGPNGRFFPNRTVYWALMSAFGTLPFMKAMDKHSV